MGKVLLESSCCMGGIVGAQALRNKKARMMQHVLAVIGRTDGLSHLDSALDIRVLKISSFPIMPTSFFPSTTGRV